MTPDVKIFGLQRSGNNWITLLMRENYYVNLYGTEDSGWKHGIYRVLEVLGREVNLIIIVKHPLAWLPSIWRWRGKKRFLSFGEYIEKTSEVELWSLMYAHWIRVHLMEHEMVIVKYEDLLADPEKECGRIASILGLRRQTDYFYVPLNKMTTNVCETDRFFEHGHYYLQHEYMHEYEPKTLKKVIERLDHLLVKYLGYDVEVTCALSA